jgi:hypothetical protein
MDTKFPAVFGETHQVSAGFNPFALKAEKQERQHDLRLACIYFP